jgi:protein O-mannosyl-transferase
MLKKLVRQNGEILLLGAIGIVTLLIYTNAFPREFTNWDDPIYVMNNPLIREFTWTNLNRILTEPFEANYHPFTLISFAVDFKIWKLNPNGYFLHNLCLHLTNITVLFLVLKRLGLSQFISLFTAFLFAIHPANVECVSWISERKSLLAALFFLVSFHQYISYRQSNRLFSYLSSLLFFLFSLLSKASTIVTPLLWIAYDCFHEKIPIRKLRLYEKIPFIAVAEIHLFLSLFAASNGHALISYHGGGPGESIIKSSYLLFRYLGMLIWPGTVNALMYPGDIPMGGKIALWIALGGVLGLFRKYACHWLFWGVWFFLFLLPVLNWVPLPIMIANRYLYLPEIGIWILMAEFLRLIHDWVPRVEAQKKNLFQKIITFLMAPRSTFSAKKVCIICLITMIPLWFLFLIDRTIQANAVWRNSDLLWNDVLSKESKSATAYFNLGAHWQELGRWGLAAAQFANTIQIDPQAGPAYAGLAKYYWLRKDGDATLLNLRAAIKSAPESDVYLKNLGSIYQAQGTQNLAQKAYLQAISINPAGLEPYQKLFDIFRYKEEDQAAMEIARLFLSRFPGRPEGYFWKGLCLKKQEKFSEAVLCFEEVRRRLPPESEEYLETTRIINSMIKKR